MGKKIFRLSLVVLLSGLVVSISSAADKNKPKTLDTDPNLAGWWKFDEASGKTTADSSGHDRSGTLKEDLSFDKNSAKGRTSKALKFDDNGYVEITKYKGVTGTRPRTVAAWIKTENGDPRKKISSSPSRSCPACFEENSSTPWIRNTEMDG